MMNILLSLASLLVLTSSTPANDVTFKYGSTPEDQSSSESLFTTNALPRNRDGSINFRLMPEVGNGHIGHVPFSDTVYLSALYNGRGGESHRARIPAFLAFEVDLSDVKKSEIVERYSLNVEQGYFEKVSTIKSKHLNISQKIYAHAHVQYPHLLVYELKVWRMKGGPMNSDIDIKLKSLSSRRSEDVDVYLHQTYNYGQHWSGKTKVPEGQSGEVQEVHIVHSRVRPYLTIYSSDENPYTKSYIMSVSHSEKQAKRYYEGALAHTSSAKLFNQHVIWWNKAWLKGRVDVGGDLKLSKMAHASLYYLLSSLPQRDDSVGGLSAGGLARGGTGTDFQGHVTWEQDAWMFPVTLLLHKDKAKSLLQYRMDRLQTAKFIAGNMSKNGARYPYQSAFTGQDVTSKFCDLCLDTSAACDLCGKITNYTEHVTTEVALAVRQYILATRDVTWLSQEGGFAFYKNLVTYLADRATFDSSNQAYSVNDVIGPELSLIENKLKIVNNSLYTNAATRLAMASAEYFWCLAAKLGQDHLPEKWETITRKMSLPRSGYVFLPYEGYSDISGEKLFFPSPIAIGYPLDLQVRPHARRTILEHYTPLIRDDAPAYTWATVAAGWAEVGDMERATEAFRKTFEGFTRQPFWIWTDTKDKSTVNRINHLTAMTSYLQALMFGFGGIRLLSDRLAFDPKLPTSDVSYLAFRGIDYMGYSFDVYYDKKNVRISLRESHPKNLVQLKISSEKFLRNFTIETLVTFKRQPFSFHLLVEDKCKLSNGPAIPTVIQPTPNEQRGHSAANSISNMSLVITTLYIVITLVCS